MNFSDTLSVAAVPVSDRFIEEYMPQANGDYVKVYLWLLRKGASGFDPAEAADRLMLTEGDVNRALRYWQEKGVILMSEEKKEEKAENSLRASYRGAESTEILTRLKADDAFQQLLIIVQSYLSRIIGEAEMQVLAYLYDGLRLPAEVIDYLVAYAVDNGHANMRYIEKTGSDWAQKGILNEKTAREYVKGLPAKRSKTSGKVSAAASRALSSDRNTDYNSIVMQELMERLVD